MNHPVNRTTPLAASLTLTALASTGTSVIWNGLPFIAKQEYGFSEAENFGLYLLIGVVYVIGASCSGKAIQTLQSFISTRMMLACLLATQAVVCSLPIFFSSGWVVWCAGGVAGICSSWVWPIVESYLVTGRHGHAMRRAIGWWNLVWMVAVAASMFAMAPLMREHASMVIVGLGALNMLAICVLPWYAPTPSRHDDVEDSEEIPDGYVALLRGARVLIPLSYAINGVLAPLLPFILSGLQVDIFWQTPLAAIWMISRVCTTAFLWHWSSWHGKWSVLWGAAAAMFLGFVCILSAGEIALLVIGLAIFGAGMGLAYYVGLYYAMSVGRAQVGAGGTHEALIGSGYMVGPLIGLATLQTVSGTQSASMQPLVFVVLGLLIVAIGALAVIWRKAR